MVKAERNRLPSLSVGVSQVLAKIGELINNPWSTLVAVLVGIVMGVFQGGWLDYLIFLSGIVSKLLRMWALPIMFTSLAISMIKFVSRPTLDRHLKNAFIYLSVGVFVMGGAGIGGG